MRIILMLALAFVAFGSTGLAQFDHTGVHLPIPPHPPIPPRDGLGAEVSYPTPGEFHIDFETGFRCDSTPLMTVSIDGGSPRIVNGVTWALNPDPLRWMDGEKDFPIPPVLAGLSVELCFTVYCVDCLGFPRTGEDCIMVTL